ncbi:F-box/LRR-repeat protein 6-like [Asterias amurensis]|uniref:F-box/LRR-repeat protein 6-like n=1 Tax=Asterias amurensis TaxID=7602 RepID=UPI003AB72FB0
MARNQQPRQRGILGVLKPAEPLLFSFLPNGAQEWPSDDDEEDSDYDPNVSADFGDEDGEASPTAISSKKKPKTSKKDTIPSRSKQKSKATKKSQKPAKGVKTDKRKAAKRRRTSAPPSKGQKVPDKNDSEVQRSSFGDPTLWGQRLPLIVLQKVYQYVVQSSGAIPFLCRACRVCRLWREAAVHSSLWQHLDLANGRIKCTDATLDWLAQNRLSQVKSINLGGWKKLTDEGIQALVTHCPKHLTTIHLNGCIKLGSKSVNALADSCPNLHTLDLSNSNADVVSISSMTNVLQSLGSRLRVLSLASNKLKAGPILKSLMTYCSNLTTLDISNCKFSSDFLMLHIEEFQRGCPKLQVLRLAGCMVRAGQATTKAQAASTGFPDLQELSLAVNTDINVSNGGIAIDDNMLLRLLVKSHQLRLLDLRGCTHITAVGIQRLPVYDLQHLFISQCSVSRYEGIEAIVQKWRHSLIELDLSWNVFPAMSLDIAIQKLSSVPGQSVLRDINLAGTSITAERVRSFLEGCPSLVSLNLASCRGLPRGMKRSYSGECLVQLKTDLRTASPSSLEYVD